MIVTEVFSGFGYDKSKYFGGNARRTEDV